MKKTLVDIDGSALREALERRNLKFAEVSVACGYTDTFITNCINRNTMNKPTMVLLERLYSISAEEYLPKKEEPPKVPENSPADDYLDRLYTIIRAAVRDAIREEREERA